MASLFAKKNSHSWTINKKKVWMVFSTIEKRNALCSSCHCAGNRSRSSPSWFVPSLVEMLSRPPLNWMKSDWMEWGALVDERSAEQSWSVRSSSSKVSSVSWVALLRKKEDFSSQRRRRRRRRRRRATPGRRGLRGGGGEDFTATGFQQRATAVRRGFRKVRRAVRIPEDGGRRGGSRSRGSTAAVACSDVGSRRRRGMAGTSATAVGDSGEKRIRRRRRGCAGLPGWRRAISWGPVWRA